MRKLFWCCAALIVAAAGGVYYLARQYECCPMSVVGQAVMTVCGAKTDDACPVGSIPEDPMPVETEEEEMDETTKTAVVAEPMLPPHITIEEDMLPGGEEDCNKDVMQRCDETPSPFGTPCTIDRKGLSADGLPEGVEESTVYPEVMPYCDDGETAPRMPKCNENGCQGGVEEVLKFWTEMAEKVSVGGIQTTEEGCADKAGTGGNCEIDVNYHRHYPSCPYTGRSQPCPAPAPAVEDKSEPKKADPTRDNKINEMLEEQERNPTRIDVDTMEFRPSDAGWHNFLPTPF